MSFVRRWGTFSSPTSAEEKKQGNVEAQEAQICNKHNTCNDNLALHQAVFPSVPDMIYAWLPERF